MQLSLKDDVNSLSFFKANFVKVLHTLKNTHRPMLITQNGRSSGVFMDMETWEKYVRTINLLRLVNEGEVSLKNKKARSLGEVKGYFRKKYPL
jgi:PHD/YefM family antitoxin component YafN of YafNO toxin-antitoxin module